ncbi:MAG: hypothetical protein ACSHW0_00565 [Thalassotalea sp.]
MKHFFILLTLLYSQFISACDAESTSYKSFYIEQLLYLEYVEVLLYIPKTYQSNELYAVGISLEKNTSVLFTGRIPFSDSDLDNFNMLSFGYDRSSVDDVSISLHYKDKKNKKSESFSFCSDNVLRFLLSEIRKKEKNMGHP